MNRRTEIDLDGKGLWDYVKNVFSANDRLNSKSTASLKKYGDYEITNIEIRRDPIMSVIDKALNLVSLGKFDDLKKKYNYDDMMHLYAVFTININGNRKPILVEKNEVINITDVIPIKTNKTESMMIGTNKGLTINSLLDNTLKAIGKDNFFIYDGFGNRNCQSFIRSILESNGIYNDRIAKFVYQSMEQFGKDLGYTTGVSKFITDIGAFTSRLLGKGNDDENWELHVVVVRKPITLEDLHKVQKEFIKTKGKFIRETNASYRIRNIPKQRFIKESFITKKLNKQISLVFGQLL